MNSHLEKKKPVPVTRPHTEHEQLAEAARDMVPSRRPDAELLNLEMASGKEGEEQTLESQKLDKTEGGELREASIEEAEASLEKTKKTSFAEGAEYSQISESLLEEGKEIERKTGDSRIRESAELMKKQAEAIKKGDKNAIGNFQRLAFYVNVINAEGIGETEHLSKISKMNPVDVLGPSEKNHALFASASLESEVLGVRADAKRLRKFAESNAGLTEEGRKALIRAAGRMGELAGKAEEQEISNAQAAQASLAIAGGIYLYSIKYAEILAAEKTLLSETREQIAPHISSMESTMETMLAENKPDKLKVAGKRFVNASNEFSIAVNADSLRAAGAAILEQGMQNPRLKKTTERLIEAAYSELGKVQDAEAGIEKRLASLRRAEHILGIARSFSTVPRNALIRKGGSLEEFIKSKKVFELDPGDRATGITKGGAVLLEDALRETDLDSLKTDWRAVRKSAKELKGEEYAGKKETKELLDALEIQMASLHKQTLSAKTPEDREISLLRIAEITETAAGYVGAIETAKSAKRPGKERKKELQKSIKRMEHALRKLASKELTKEKRKDLIASIEQNGQFVLEEQAQARIDAFRKKVERGGWGGAAKKHMLEFADTAERAVGLGMHGLAEQLVKNGNLYINSRTIRGIAGKRPTREKMEITRGTAAEYESSLRKKGVARREMAHVKAQKDILASLVHAQEVLDAAERRGGAAMQQAYYAMNSSAFSGAKRLSATRNAWTGAANISAQADSVLEFANNVIPKKGAVPSRKNTDKFIEDVEVAAGTGNNSELNRLVEQEMGSAVNLDIAATLRPRAKEVRKQADAYAEQAKNAKSIAKSLEKESQEFRITGEKKRSDNARLAMVDIAANTKISSRNLDNAAYKMQMKLDKVEKILDDVERDPSAFEPMELLDPGTPVDMGDGITEMGRQGELFASGYGLSSAEQDALEASTELSAHTMLGGLVLTVSGAAKSLGGDQRKIYLRMNIPAAIEILSVASEKVAGRWEGDWIRKMDGTRGARPLMDERDENGQVTRRGRLFRAITDEIPEAARLISTAMAVSLVENTESAELYAGMGMDIDNPNNPANTDWFAESMVNSFTITLLGVAAVPKTKVRDPEYSMRYVPLDDSRMAGGKGKAYASAAKNFNGVAGSLMGHAATDINFWAFEIPYEIESAINSARVYASAKDVGHTGWKTREFAYSDVLEAGERIGMGLERAALSEALWGFAMVMLPGGIAGVAGNTMRFAESAKALRGIGHAMILADTFSGGMKEIQVMGRVSAHTVSMMVFMATAGKAAKFTNLRGIASAKSIQRVQTFEKIYGIGGGLGIAGHGTYEFFGHVLPAAQATGRAISSLEYFSLFSSFIPLVQGPLTLAEVNVMGRTYRQAGRALLSTRYSPETVADISAVRSGTAAKGIVTSEMVSAKAKLRTISEPSARPTKPAGRKLGIELRLRNAEAKLAKVEKLSVQEKKTGRPTIERRRLEKEVAEQLREMELEVLEVIGAKVAAGAEGMRLIPAAFAMARSATGKRPSIELLKRSLKNLKGIGRGKPAQAPKPVAEPAPAKLRQNLETLGITDPAKIKAARQTIGPAALEARTNALLNTFKGRKELGRKIVDAKPELLTQSQVEFEKNIRRFKDTGKIIERVEKRMQKHGISPRKGMEQDVRPYLSKNFRGDILLGISRGQVDALGLTPIGKYAPVTAKTGPKVKAKSGVVKKYKTREEKQVASFMKRYSVPWAKKTIAENPPGMNETAKNRGLRELALNRIAKEPAEVRTRLKEEIMENTPKELRSTMDMEWKVYVEGRIPGANKYNPIKEMFGFKPIQSEKLAPEIKQDIADFLRAVSVEGPNAHGVKGGHGRFTGIIVTGQLHAGAYVGPLKKISGGDRSLSAVGSGPFWTMTVKEANAVGGPITAKQHIAYVCPSEKYMMGSSRAVKDAYSQGMMTRTEAVGALSKLMSAAEAKEAPATSFRSQANQNAIAKRFWAERDALGKAEIRSLEITSGMKVREVAAKPKENIVEMIKKLRAEEKGTRRPSMERAKLERQIEQNPQLKAAVEEYKRTLKVRERAKKGGQLGALVGNIREIQAEQIKKAEKNLAKAEKNLVEAEGLLVQEKEVGVRSRRRLEKEAAKPGQTEAVDPELDTAIKASFTGERTFMGPEGRMQHEYIYGRGKAKKKYTEKQAQDLKEIIGHAEKVVRGEKTNVPERLKPEVEMLAKDKEFQDSVKVIDELRGVTGPTQVKDASYYSKIQRNRQLDLAVEAYETYGRGTLGESVEVELGKLGITPEYNASIMSFYTPQGMGIKLKGQWYFVKETSPGKFEAREVANPKEVPGRKVMGPEIDYIATMGIQKGSAKLDVPDQHILRITKSETPQAGEAARVEVQTGEIQFSLRSDVPPKDVALSLAKWIGAKKWQFRRQAQQQAPAPRPAGKIQPKRPLRSRRVTREGAKLNKLSEPFAEEPAPAKKPAAPKEARKKAFDEAPTELAEYKTVVSEADPKEMARKRAIEMLIAGAKKKDVESLLGQIASGKLKPPEYERLFNDLKTAANEIKRMERVEEARKARTPEELKTQEINALKEMGREGLAAKYSRGREAREKVLSKLGIKFYEAERSAELTNSFVELSTALARGEKAELYQLAKKHGIKPKSVEQTTRELDTLRDSIRDEIGGINAGREASGETAFNLVVRGRLQERIGSIEGYEGFRITEMQHLGESLRGVYKITLRKGSQTRKIFVKMENVEPAELGKQLATASGLFSSRIFFGHEYPTGLMDGKQPVMQKFGMMESIQDYGGQKVRMRLPTGRVDAQGNTLTSIREVEVVGVAMLREEVFKHPTSRDPVHQEFYKMASTGEGRVELFNAWNRYHEYSRRVLLSDRYSRNTAVFLVKRPGSAKPEIVFQPIDMDFIGRVGRDYEGKTDFTMLYTEFRGATRGFLVQISKATEKLGPGKKITQEALLDSYEYAGNPKLAEWMPMEEVGRIVEKADGKPIGPGMDPREADSPLGPGKITASGGNPYAVVLTDAARTRMDAKEFMKAIKGAKEDTGNFWDYQGTYPNTERMYLESKKKR